MEYVLQPLILRRVRHSRMLLAGIQAEVGLDPRLKHSGVTVLGVASLDPSQIFEGGHEEHEVKEKKNNLPELRVLRAFVVQIRFPV
jgi:hypothetical protein